VKIDALKIFFGIALIAFSVHAENFNFENNFAQFTISSASAVVSLLDKSSGQEWLQPGKTSGASAFAIARAKGHSIASTAIARDGDTFKVQFGKSDVEADLHITARSNYFVFDLLAVRGDGVEELSFAKLPVKSAPHSSGILNVKWDDEFTVCLMALDQKLETSFGPNGSLQCATTPEFGLAGHKAALIAVPTTNFNNVVHEVEKDFKIPHATIDGQWAKTSEAVRRSYLFVNLTEENADEIIRLAKLGGFSTILIYSGTWSTSNGSYPINTKNFPGGEASLKAVVEKCHAAGLKVGIHTLTSFIAKNDPLVRPKPDSRLLKDGEAILANDLDANAKEISTTSALKNFPGESSYYGERGGMDVQIDDEIIRYESVGGKNSAQILNCTRGINGTRAATHKAGAKIFHLAQRYNSYLADLRSTLKDEIAERIAGVINRCKLDMIYFDGGEVNSANGPNWYWVGVQQSAVFSRVKRDLLAQGSGRTAWTWHVFSRGTCDDFAALAPKQFLDFHKIADSWNAYHNAFLPAELGWWGFLSATPDHPATMPDEVEFYATRMLALDSAVSLETRLADLKKNGRTEELLQLLGDYEKLRLSRAVPISLREKLRTGEWHATRDANGDWKFQPVKYDSQRAQIPAKFAITNSFASQPLRFRIQVAPELAPIGDDKNIPLLKPKTPLKIPLPDANAAMPGALAQRFVFAKAAGDEASALMVGATDSKAGKLRGKFRDLVHHRALAVRIEVEDIGSGNESPAVLNVQLESDGKRFRDHYIDLNFTGERTIILPEPTAERMLAEFRPKAANYSFKLAGYTFNYERIVALNLRWMRLPNGKLPRCKISLVEALAESDDALENPRIILGEKTFPISAKLQTGDYAEFLDGDSIRIFDANGAQKQTVAAPKTIPVFKNGIHEIKLEAENSAPVKMTLVTLGAPENVKSNH
jgi:hypothetical protein